MPDARVLLAAVVLAAPFVAGTAAGAGQPTSEVAFTFADRAINESSGLVSLGDRVVTTNDSGDGARVFVVDADTGETVREVGWTGEARDIEALAPAGPDAVWVGDIGDNRDARDAVTITRVELSGEAEPVSYTLEHPDGPHDAEALMTHPLTGQLFVVTKGVLSGSVMRVPSDLEPGAVNRMEEVGRAPGIVTDAAFLPGGGAVVVRTYARAVVLAHPSWRVVAGWDLPDQRQGEGLAVDGTDLLISSEGLHEDVLRVPLPAEALAADWRGSPARAVWQLLATLPTGPRWSA